MSDGGEWQVVFGASGGIGQALVRELAARGKRVRAVNRSGRTDVPPGVEVARGDATDPASAREACRGAAVVYNCANPPYTEWAAKFPPIMAGLIEAAGEAGARLVFADNLYAYGPTGGPITEDLPYRATGTKGRVRREVADMLMAAHAGGKVRAAIGRCSDYYGPAVVNSFTGADMFRSLLAGKRVMWVGDLDTPHSLTYIEDAARGLAVLGEHDEALGQAWHIPSGEALSGRQFLQLAFEIAGRPVKLGTYGPLALRLAGLFVPDAREAIEMLYEFEAPFVLNADKFQRAFGPFEATPAREGLEKTLSWFKAH